MSNNTNSKTKQQHQARVANTHVLLDLIADLFNTSLIHIATSYIYKSQRQKKNKIPWPVLLKPKSYIYTFAMRGGARQRYLQLTRGPPEETRDRSRSPPRAPDHRRGGARATAVRAQAPGERDDAVGNRFYSYVSQLQLSNQLSAVQTQYLASTASGAGALGVRDLAATGARGACPGNMHRDLLRQYLKGTSVPRPYFAEVPIHDPRTDEDGVKVMLPFLLPHEMVNAISKKNLNVTRDLSELPDGSPLDDAATSFAREHNVPRERVVPIGFHGDGVPHKRNKSVQVFSWNFLSKGMSERFLFTSIDKDFCCQCGCGGRCTLDAIVDVFAWSMKTMSLGRWPRKRHDGTAWLPSDKTRRASIGRFFAFGILLQARGDWSWFKELFGFPSWSSSSICWRCKAMKDGDYSYHLHGVDALWRDARLSSMDFFHLQLSMGIMPSPLFSIPHFTLAMVVIDVLHIMDLGVTQDALGNLFYEAQKYFIRGRNQKLRVKELFKKVQAYYRISNPTSQIQALTFSMIKVDAKAPKLKLKGAETRGMVPFGLELATEMHIALDTLHSETVRRAFVSLFDLYTLMAAEVYDSAAAASTCREFCLHYGALSEEARRERPDTVFWKEKPKIHLLQELFEFQGREFDMNPSTFWCYRDEDFVGWVAKFAGSRGGPNRCVSNATRVIQRYRAWIREL